MSIYTAALAKSIGHPLNKSYYYVKLTIGIIFLLFFVQIMFIKQRTSDRFYKQVEFQLLYNYYLMNVVNIKTPGLKVVCFNFGSYNIIKKSYR